MPEYVEIRHNCIASKHKSNSYGNIQKNIISQLSPDKIIIERMTDERFKKKLRISDERPDEISKALLNI